MTGTSQDFEVSIEDANVSLSVSETVVSVHIESAKTEQDVGFSDEEVLVNGHTVNVELSAAGPAKSTNGGVFITDVLPSSPADNVSNKIFSSGGALASFLTTTRNIEVQMLVFTGHSVLRPELELFETPITLSATDTIGVWNGTVSVEVPEGVKSLVVMHPDGPVWKTSFEFEVKPEISSLSFTGTYPGTQTELKENDIFGFSVESDSSFVAIEVENYGAFKAQAVSFSSTKVYSGTGIVANLGTSPSAKTFKARIQAATGAWSDWAESTDTVVLNNLKPSVSLGVTYPGGQQAIKDNEQATVSISCSNYDTFLCSSTQLDIPNPEVFAATKAVVRKAGVDYNVSANNFTATATRAANGATTSASTLVRIVNVAATFNIVVSAMRLRSGGNMGTAAQSHAVTVGANQPLAAAPTFTAPSGTLGPVTGSGSVWSAAILIHDNDVKGTFSWGSPAGVGLSGIPATGSGQYTVGGFVKRTMTISAWPVRVGQIGAVVADIAKLRCTNLSKGPSGSNNFTYQATTDEEANRFTIIGGDEWYNCDGLNASSNTTGTMQVELEEVT